MTRIRLASTFDLFINELVMSGPWVVSDFVTPTLKVVLNQFLWIYKYNQSIFGFDI